MLALSLIWLNPSKPSVDRSRSLEVEPSFSIRLTVLYSLHPEVT